MWIHEHQDWPTFTWDAEALASKLADIRHRQGRLLGRMEGLGFKVVDSRVDALVANMFQGSGMSQENLFKTAQSWKIKIQILTDDIVKSSAIEGEDLNPEEVRSSIARKLGIDIAGLIPASRDGWPRDRPLG